MIKNKIDTIVFDLGGVLVDWNPIYVYKKVFDNDMEKVHWFLNTVCTSDWNIEQDAGRKIDEAVRLKTAEFPEYAPEIALFYKEWHHMFSGPIFENLELFKKLKASNNYKLYALTNWCAEKWQKALELFPFFYDFDDWIVSGQEKTRKPYPEIYTILLDRFEINPKKAIFIDDNAENVDAAKKLGMSGIHFENHEQLIQQLKKHHIDW